MNRLERGLAAAIIGFPVAVIASKLGTVYLEQGWFAALPLLAAAILGVLGFEYMRRKDEMHQRILLEAAAFAVAVTFAVSLAWLLLQGWLALPSSPAAITVVALLGASWFVGLALSWRRYR